MWILRVVECALADAKWQWPDPESLGLVVQKVVYARNVESNSLMAGCWRKLGITIRVRIGITLAV